MIKIDHFGICAKDTDKLAQWYVDVLGFKVIKVNKNKIPRTYFIGDDNGYKMEIFGAHESSDPLSKNVQGLRHIALVSENFDEYVDHLKANSITIVDDVKMSTTGVRILFFRDIEGNILHLNEKA
ncbi:VOC family protein [Desulfitobacterium hafniense]|uniref:VOC family protein n=1 Tax=Desulfitobacterium hafniense TaxID=49338 RepID=UPI00036B850F|nr:VOC family protein [Desulfitobacterium hafniense]